MVDVTQDSSKDVKLMSIYILIVLKINEKVLDG